LLAVIAAGCADYDAGAIDRPVIVTFPGSFSSLGPADAGATDGASSIVTIDTWQPPAGDAKTADSGADTAVRRAGDVIWWDVGGEDAGPTDPIDAGGIEDGGASEDGSPMADAGSVDDSVDDGVDDADEDAEDAPGPLPDVILPPEDGGAIDSAADAGATDTSIPDTSDPDAGPADSGPPDAEEDAGPPDVVEDAGPPDVVEDAGPPDVDEDAGPPDVVEDAGPPDVQEDTAPVDAGPPDVAADAGPPDTVADAEPPDADPVDSGPPDSGGGDAVDAAWDPDWGGYGDVSFPDGADVHGGVLDSCWSLYGIVFEETCTNNQLTVECVDKEAALGSLWAQYLFEPLRKCLVANCIPKCTGPNSDKCMEQCRSKKCAYPLFACASEGESGKNNCPTTFACMQKYDNKFFSMAFHCFGTASPMAKKQLAEFFACGTEPQTDSCFDQIAACYGPQGNLTCNEAIQCSEACPNGDDVCGFECIGKADADGQKKLDALWDCIVAKCQGQGDPCISKECPLEVADCIDDKK